MATKVKLIADGVITPDQITLTTASTGTNTTAPATTAFVQQEISALVDSSPDALNTLNELAAALGDDANFSTTVTNSIATKLPLAGGTLTGTLNVSATTNARDIKISAGYHLQRSDHHSGHLEGSYNNVGVNSSKSNPIYTIGSSYNPTDAALSNMYGIGYTSSSASFASPAGTTNWGMYVAADGDARVWLDGSNGTIWSTGEHYSNNNRVFHDGYHPNADAWTTARTITLGGDLTGNVSIDGSANVTLTAAVVDDSHNHVISNVDGLQTALDGKLSTTGTAANSQLLDSLDSSQFLRSDTSDTLTSGTLTITGSTSAENAFRTTNGRIQLGHHSNGSGIWFDEANTAQYWFAGLTGQSFRLYRNANQLTLTNVGSLSTGAQGTVWGASNDGSGSGLDADTVDGIQSSRIVYGDNGTGTNSISGSALNPSGHLKSGFYKVTSASSTIPNATSVNFVMHTSYDTEGNTAGFDLAANDSTTSKFYLRPATGGGRGAWQTIWTSSSDGSGSGLDADLLDGQHGSHYLNYNNFTNTPTIPTNNNQLTNGAGYLTQSSAFNNQGQSHSTRTSFATGTPSFPFGFNFVQGSGNSPGVNSATQYYSLYTGLGSQYPATGSGSYGMEVAFPRNVSSPYIAIRYNENNSLGSWQKISAGYADSAGSVAWANVTGAPTIPTNNNQLTNGAGYITGVTDVAGWAGQLLREDNRIIAPNELTAGRLKFGFTSWANNNSSPYADFLHLRSYTDASGGADNLVMFKKSGIGMRIWQQTYGSTTAYSSYADVWHTSNDGSGSGLDADTVDGIQGGSLLRSDANDSWSGLLTSTISAGSTALDLSTNDGYANMRVIRNNGSSNTDGMFIGYGNANSGITRIFGGGATSGGIVVSGSGANDIKYSGSSVLWHAGNDGSGSGLDADNLDGYAWTSQNKAVAARNLTIEAGDGQGLSFWGGTATPAGSNSYAIFMGTSGTYGRVDGETTSDYNMYFKMTAGTNRGFVFRNNTNNVVGIDSTGNLRAEADIVAYSGSDIRLKDNLTVISNPLEKLSKLSGYSFEWNSKQSAYAEGKKDIGLVAQEVEEVLPEIVKTRQDGFKGLQYEKLIPLLVEGMKEQQQQIEELKQQVKDLQGQK